MSRKKIVIGAVGVIVVLAAVGSAAGGSQNTLADEPRPTALTSAAPTSSDTASAPSEAPAASSTEPAETQASSDTYTVGDRVKLGDEEYFSITTVDPAPKVELVKPDAGNKYISVLAEIEGINANGATYNPFFFTARGDDGFEYNVSAFGKEPALKSSNDLGPGKSVKGWVSFEIPAAATHLTIVYAPGFFNEPVEVGVDL